MLQDTQPEGLVPHVIMETDMVRLWHKLNVGFHAPKAVIYASFRLPDAYLSPEASVLTKLFVKLLSDYLNETLYPAQLAGMRTHVGTTQKGLLLTIKGFVCRVVYRVCCDLCSLPGYV